MIGLGKLKHNGLAVHFLVKPIKQLVSLCTAVSLATMSVVTDSVYPAPISPIDVAMEKVYFQNGLLRANVSWKFDEGIMLYYDLPAVKAFDLLNFWVF